jgi:hypothetical protein
MNLYNCKGAITNYTRVIRKRIASLDGEVGEVTMENLIWLFIAATVVFIVGGFTIHTLFPGVQAKIMSILGLH